MFIFPIYSPCIIKITTHSITHLHRLNNPNGESQYHRKSRIAQNNNNHHASPRGFTSVARRFIVEPKKLGRKYESPIGTLLTVRRFLGETQKLYEKQLKQGNFMQLWSQ